MRNPVLAVLAAAVLAACSQSAGPLPVDLREGIAARYEPSFLAVQAALDDRDTASAEAVLVRLRSQLERESVSGTGEVAREARAAVQLADGFDRIIAGRKRLEALEMELELLPEGEGSGGGAGNHTLHLLVTNRWDAELKLVPGPANLILARTQVDQAGRQAGVTRSLTLDPIRVSVPPGATERVELGTFASRVSGDALAERLTFRLEVRSGELEEDGSSFPAQRYGVEPLEYVGLAPFLPNGALEPAELAGYLQRPEPASAPIMERAIRILPNRRMEALELLEPLVQRATEQEFQRMAPALQWLAPEGPGVSGREPWLRWLRSLRTE